MMVQMLTRDAHLELAVNRYVDRLSRDIQPQDRSEKNFSRFVAYVNAVAARQYPGAAKPGLTAHKKPGKSKQPAGKTAPKSPAG